MVEVWKVATMVKNTRASAQVWWQGLLVRAVLTVLVFLWYPLDRLAAVWPAFGVPFRALTQNAPDVFVVHTVFFFALGCAALALLPAVRSKSQWYFIGLFVAAGIQASFQEGFRGEALPSSAIQVAYLGNMLGGILALVVWSLVTAARRRTRAPAPLV